MLLTYVRIMISLGALVCLTFWGAAVPEAMAQLEIMTSDASATDWNVVAGIASDGAVVMVSRGRGSPSSTIVVPTDGPRPPNWLRIPPHSTAALR